MLALIVAGEAVFMLPFVVARVFRTTFLEVFALSNFQLASAHSVYGMVAMASYFFGGPQAARFAARTLIVLALVGPASGGIVFAHIPSTHEDRKDVGRETDVTISDYIGGS